jgi:hypothetical protein
MNTPAFGHSTNAARAAAPPSAPDLVNLQNREEFSGWVWNYRRNGDPFLLDLHCFTIFSERGRPIY